jgi:hypothetical protein
LVLALFVIHELDVYGTVLIRKSKLALDTPNPLVDVLIPDQELAKRCVFPPPSSGILVIPFARELGLREAA